MLKQTGHRRKLNKRAMWREIQPSLTEDDFISSLALRAGDLQWLELLFFSVFCMETLLLSLLTSRAVF